jgi:hypothetical protein
MIERDQLAAYEPFSIEIDTADVPTTDALISSVELHSDSSGWLVTYGADAAYVPCLPILDHGQVVRAGIEPRIGDRLRIYGDHGIALNDWVVFYWTPEQLAFRAEYTDRLARAHAERVFAVRRPTLDAAYKELPAPLQRLLVVMREVEEFRVRDEARVVARMTLGIEIAEVLTRANPEDPLQAWDDVLTRSGNGSRSIGHARDALADTELPELDDREGSLAMYFARELLKDQKESNERDG